MNLATIRRIFLIVAAGVFFIIAVGSLVAPQIMATKLGYTLSSVDAFSEFRAVYVGMWLAMAVFLLIAARNIELTLLGDLGVLLILGQTVGRVISILLDGFPSTQVWPIAILEVLGGLAILFIRPKQASS